MKKLVILGGSGIGMIAASINEINKEYGLLGFINDYYEPGVFIGKYRKIPVIGKSDDVIKYLQDGDVYFFVGYVGMQNEKSVFEKIINLGIPEDRYASLIHPTAIIPDGYCSVGHGVMFAPLSQLSPDTTIGDNCILLPNSFVGHDTVMKRFSHVATNGVIGANVVVGTAVHVGSNATIREKINIGDYSLIGSGSVVLKDVPENSIVVGNPARLLKSKE